MNKTLADGTVIIDRGDTVDLWIGDGLLVGVPIEEKASFFPEPSEWECHLFGSGANGIVLTPNKGEEPNAFWRLMQYLAFGNRWVKKGK